MAVAHHQSSSIAGVLSHSGSVTLSGFALGAGSDLVMVAFVAYEVRNLGAGAPAPVSVTWNGSEGFTKVLTQEHASGGGTTDEHLDIWVLEDPTVATADVVCNLGTSGDDAAIWVQVYSAADGAGASDGNAVLAGACPDASVITTVADAMVAGACIRSTRDNGNPWTPDSGVTQRAQLAHGAGAGSGMNAFGGDMEAATTGTYNFGAAAGSEDYVVAAVEIQPAGGGGGATNATRRRRRRMGMSFERIGDLFVPKRRPLIVSVPALVGA
jgi:hypothetical protein